MSDSIDAPDSYDPDSVEDAKEIGAELAKRAWKIQYTVGDIEQRVGHLEERVDAAEDQWDEAAIEELHARVSALAMDVSDLDTAILQLESDISTLGNETEAELQALTDRVNALEEADGGRTGEIDEERLRELVHEILEDILSDGDEPLPDGGYSIGSYGVAVYGS